MNFPTDELLVAFVDGELDGADRARVAAAIKDDPDVKARAKQFEDTAQLLRAAFSLEDDQGDHGPLGLDITGFGTGEEKTEPQSKGVVLSFPARAARLVGGLDHRTAIAASFALFVGGISIGVLMDKPEVGEYEPAGVHADATLIAASTPLHTALETTPSADSVFGPVDTALGGPIQPVATYRNPEGGFCRHFQVTSENSVAEGLACRGAKDKAWRLNVLHAYKPAEGAGELDARPAALEKAFSELALSQPLSEDEEAKLLNAGWRSSSLMVKGDHA